MPADLKIKLVVSKKSDWVALQFNNRNITETLDITRLDPIAGGSIVQSREVQPR
jgi:hypothetical protein